MALTLVRVDDRLIHGQVAAIWLKELPARRIIIVDDATARDEFLREVIELAAPGGVEVEVLDLDRGIERLRRAESDPEPAFALFRSPFTALAIRRAGVEFPVLNVGGLGMRPGRRRIHRSVAAADDELAALHELERLGTRVEIRIVPGDRPAGLPSIGAST